MPGHPSIIWSCHLQLYHWHGPITPHTTIDRVPHHLAFMSHSLIPYLHGPRTKSHPINNMALPPLKKVPLSLGNMALTPFLLMHCYTL